MPLADEHVDGSGCWEGTGVNRQKEVSMALKPILTETQWPFCLLVRSHLRAVLHFSGMNMSSYWGGGEDVVRWYYLHVLLALGSSVPKV